MNINLGLPGGERDIMMGMRTVIVGIGCGCGQWWWGWGQNYGDRYKIVDCAQLWTYTVYIPLKLLCVYWC